MSGGIPAKNRSPHDSIARKDEEMNPNNGIATPIQGPSSSKLGPGGSIDSEDLDDSKTRNHSLKYSKGALTGNTTLVQYDDNLVKRKHPRSSMQEPYRQDS